ncbi:MAG: hypothetical protein GC146_00905 [Limimaricola sp.]|uniref:LytTR family DNA-binding domain-containing protein n=1 Tax=Limimaricola sp. TaxID=2211665 RepID=UPI001D9DD188|nr:LytTR family DNA-binding domain-containing protein [Limimaricola sp.]MBI1415756.1 hypothetical protein [Limimaricola sp.]
MNRLEALFRGIAPSGREGLRLLVIWLAMSLVMTALGPFGSYHEVPTVPRAAFWFGIDAVAIILGLVVRRATQGLMAGRSEWVREGVSIVIFTLLFSLGLDTLIAVIGHHATPIPPLAEIVALVFVITLAVTAAYRIVGEHLRSGRKAPERPRFYGRLAVGPQSALLRLAVDDHYVEAHFADGTSQRVLMRFSDAIAEMEGVEGFSTHRSHWVAREAVRGAARHKGRDVLVLIDGSEVPVSRTFRPELVEAGLIEES